MKSKHFPRDILSMKCIAREGGPVSLHPYKCVRNGSGVVASCPFPCVLSQVYSDYESNPQLRQAIEFACRQFYVLHRKPFVLQLFASVAPLLEFPVSRSHPPVSGRKPGCAATPIRGHKERALHRTKSPLISACFRALLDGAGC